MVFRVFASVLALALALGCGDDGRRIGRDAGDGPTDGGQPVGRDGTSGGGDGCLNRAEWIYLVDSDDTLIRFEPDTLTFTNIGSLTCDPTGSTHPFSMSVDRQARAWVLYSDGRVHRASTLDASCESTGFTPNQAGFEVFGMGFAADAAGSEEETLFVAGGSELGIATGSANLGRIDTGTLTLTDIASLPGWPELTGTGAGELWGFFPQTSPASIRRIDKATGATPDVFDLDALGSVDPSAWAFAFWGGRYYVFLQESLSPSTDVWRLDPSDGTFTRIVENTGRRIVGAGVSTCAPVELI